MEVSDGAVLTAHPATFGKKDTVEFEQILPSERGLHQPELQSNEALASELYMVRWTGEAVQPVMVQIPVARLDWSVRAARIRLRPLTDTQEWTDMTELELKPNSVQLELIHPCSFCVIARPRQELFTAPVAGVLYNAKINKFLSIRFPKKVIDRDIEVGIKMDGVDAERLRHVQQTHKQRCGDVLHKVAHFIDIRPERPMLFKRAVTVKLPLPEHEEKEFDPNEPNDIISVLQQKSDTSWELLDVTLKFTRQIVSFDVKTLGRYCVAMAYPNKFRKLPTAISLVEDQTSRVEGEVMTFIKYEAKSWQMALEVCSLTNRNKVETKWINQGFEYLAREEEEAAVIETDNFRQNFRGRRKVQFAQEEYTDPAPSTNKIQLANHCKYYFELSGDLRLKQETTEGTTKENAVYYHTHLALNSVTFGIEPRMPEARSLEGSVAVYDVPTTVKRQRLQLTKWRVPQQHVEDYFVVEQITPPPEEEQPVIEIPDPDQFVSKEEESAPPLAQRFSYTPRDEQSYKRLITLKRPPIYIDKEPRVLSGRSLRALAAAVPQGLTLAVHLHLSDSSITGIGFDALANGLSLNEVTYKILMYWKRMHGGNATEKISDMVQAYRDMGQLDLAELIEDREEENKDIEMSEACLAACR